MAPEMWLELSPSHIRHAQLAAVRQQPQGMHDAALLLHRSHVLPCRLRAACLPVVVPRLGGSGRFFFEIGLQIVLHFFSLNLCLICFCICFAICL